MGMFYWFIETKYVYNVLRPSNLALTEAPPKTKDFPLPSDKKFCSATLILDLLDTFLQV